MTTISAEMTVSDALPFCSPAKSRNLKPLAETFGIKLCEFHIGHIRTYQDERITKVDPYTIDCEVEALLTLLDGLGLGEPIRRNYSPLGKRVELTPEERHDLPDRVRVYIENLEGELQSLRFDKDTLSNRLQKANWARWRR